MDILRDTHPIARKEHKCQFCGGIISIGEKYYRQTNVYDGRVYDWISHTECTQLSHALDMYNYCDEGLDTESFRNNIDEYVYENHYDKERGTIAEDWKLPYPDLVKKVLEEFRKGE